MKTVRLARLTGTIATLVFAFASSATAAVNFSPTTYLNPTGSFIFGSETGDFNNDGKPDVVIVTNQYISYYQCVGDGTLRPPVSSYTGVNTSVSGYKSVAIADFNNDGKLDVSIAHSIRLEIGLGIYIGVLTVHFGDGAGHFNTGLVKITDSPMRLAHGDFDADGNVDLIVMSPDFLWFYLGNGDGTFQPALGRPRPGSTTVLITGNVDNSGGDDLVMAEPLGSVIVWRDAGFTGASPQILPNAVEWPNPSLAVGDLDNDGNADLVVGSWSYDFGSFRGAAATFLGNGQGDFTFRAKRGGGVGVAVADFNTDGNLDIVTGGRIDPTGISVFVGDGTGGMSNLPDFFFGPTTSPLQFGIADFDDDGRPDFVAADMGQTFAGSFAVMINGSTWGCVDMVALDYSAGTLTLGFTIKTVVPALWSTWIVWDGGAAPLWSTEIPPVQPAVSFNVPIPNVPPLGNIAILTALSHPTLGPMCGDFKIVDTGAANGRSR